MSSLLRIGESLGIASYRYVLDTKEETMIKVLECRVACNITLDIKENQLYTKGIPPGRIPLILCKKKKFTFARCTKILGQTNLVNVPNAEEWIS